MLYGSSEVRLISRPFISTRANGVAVADSPPPTAAQTHGNHEADGRARMLHDTPQANWRTYSDQWQLGENWNAE